MTSPVARLAGPVAITLCSLFAVGTCWAADDGVEPASVEFPDGDPSVPAELGGPGFTGGEGWVTVADPRGGSSDAVKGGSILTSTPNWPENLRMFGTGSNTFLNTVVESLCFETLCKIDSNTLEFEPGLATHWKISEDKMTFTFRIDPRAHWADGKPITSEDLVATYKLGSDPTTIDPMFRSSVTDKMEEPKPLSKYLVEVTCKVKDWRNFITIASMRVLPAHEIGELSGEEYLEKYNFELPTGSGPYELRKEDVKDNESMTLSRRPDYWGVDLPGNRGLYNFDRIRFVVVRDQRKSFEMARKGDLDFYPVYTAQWWVEDLEVAEKGGGGGSMRTVGMVFSGLVALALLGWAALGATGGARVTGGVAGVAFAGLAGWAALAPQSDDDSPDLGPVEKGWLVMQKVYTKYPQGIQGLAFNTREAPLDDVRVRKAIAHLYDRETMVDKFAYGEYDLLKSYFPGGDAENPDNELVDYDPRSAVDLLEEAGWTEIGDDGIRRKDGERLSITISYRTSGLGKYYTTFKEDAKKAGVEVNLDLITPETHWKNQQEQNFQVSSAAWGAILFPNPKPNYHSSMADEEGSNNITGLRSPKVDAIIEEYDAEFDADRRTELLRELDGLIFEEHQYALAWYLPCERLLYWNKFGMPETVLPKYGDWRDAFAYWWVDEERKEALESAMEDDESLETVPARIVRPWDESPDDAVASN